MTEIIIIIMTMILVDNCVLSQFLGICPFLGVSKKLDSAVGMGVAVIFVMVLATAATYPIMMLLIDCLYLIFKSDDYMIEFITRAVKQHREQLIIQVEQFASQSFWRTLACIIRIYQDFLEMYE